MNIRRIAVSGAAGIGKSTLCERLAAVCEYPLLPDVVDQVLREHGYESWGQVRNPEEAIGIRLQALDRKIEAEVNNACFVSDIKLPNH